MFCLLHLWIKFASSTASLNIDNQNLTILEVMKKKISKYENEF